MKSLLFRTDIPNPSWLNHVCFQADETREKRKQMRLKSAALNRLRPEERPVTRRSSQDRRKQAKTPEKEDAKVDTPLREDANSKLNSIPECSEEARSPRTSIETRPPSPRTLFGSEEFLVAVQSALDKHYRSEEFTAAIKNLNTQR